MLSFDEYVFIIILFSQINDKLFTLVVGTIAGHPTSHPDRHLRQFRSDVDSHTQSRL